VLSKFFPPVEEATGEKKGEASEEKKEEAEA
jgi:hypothetical protein